MFNKKIIKIKINWLVNYQSLFHSLYAFSNIATSLFSYPTNPNYFANKITYGLSVVIFNLTYYTFCKINWIVSKSLFNFPSINFDAGCALFSNAIKIYSKLVTSGFIWTIKFELKIFLKLTLYSCLYLNDSHRI